MREIVQLSSAASHLRVARSRANRRVWSTNCKTHVDGIVLESWI